MKYPKINSLYKREEKGDRKIMLGDYSCPEFTTIDKWTVTEKVDGTNIRITFDRKNTGVEIQGRSDEAQIPPHLFKVLQETFTWLKMDGVFKESNYVVLFGEGFGPKIQSGDYYCKTPSFVLFDVFCSGFWLKREDVAELAGKLGIDHVPLLLNYEGDTVWKTQDIVEFVQGRPLSGIAKEQHVMEGIVARSEPLMMFRIGGPILFKLKAKDF